MIIYPELYSSGVPYCLAAATYLDGYFKDGLLHLPKRIRKDVTNASRIPHLEYWSERLHKEYLKLPDTIALEQFMVLDDSWAEKTFTLLREKCPQNLNQGARIAFYMWERILFWSQYHSNNWYEVGFVASAQQIRSVCGGTLEFILKIIDAMLDAGLIHRKWTGNNLMGRGSCYLAGDNEHLEQLLEESKNPI